MIKFKMFMNRFRHTALMLLVALFVTKGFAQEEKPPNVILVMTDDQGIGDLGCHDNPWIKTPNIDKFYKQAVRMTDFHVSPMCTPTRAALMTGRYPVNNGTWATYKGRDALAENANTMADVFQKNGYKTAMFGKWHLGDNYPSRPTDSGFDVAIHHKAGGVGELSDYWGNSYNDDVYYVNNEPKQFSGYCTDVWFQEAMGFMDKNKDAPFFLYLPTNAPHSPLIVAEKYAAPYRHLVGDKIVGAEFYGMITNIDENFGKLEAYLKEKKLADNTILIYMTDNGSGGGLSEDGKLGFNKGFRGRKGQRTEGGHRVPFFIRWKDGKIKGGKDLNELTAHVDLIPTLAGLCNLEIPEGMKLDGIDFSPLLLNNGKLDDKRTVFVHTRQDWRTPHDKEGTAILNEKWRLVNGKELYDIEADKHQDIDVASGNKEVVEGLLSQNKAFLDVAKSGYEYQQFPVSTIGNDSQKEIKLTIQHAIGEEDGIWKPEQVASGIKNRNNTHSIKVEKAGRYKISCMRWPKECAGPILGIPTENPKNQYEYKTMHPEKVRIQIANQIKEQTVEGDMQSADFILNLEEGKTMLVNDFIENGETFGVYYTYIEYLGK
ncbi:arylsulfatase [Zobellia nedashkovskayae]